MNLALKYLDVVSVTPIQVLNINIVWNERHGQVKNRNGLMNQIIYI